MQDYSEAERRLIESRNQPAAGQGASSSVDQLSTPRIDKKPQAKDVDLPGMVNQVNQAAQQQQANAPTVFDTLDKDMPWLKWVGGALGALGTAYGINRFLGEGSSNEPTLRDRTQNKPTTTVGSPEVAQSSMTVGEPKIVADPVPVAPKPVTDTVTVAPAPETTATIVPETAKPQNIPVPTAAEQQPQVKYGETKYNVPTASPEVPVAPPAEVAPAPVAPKPLSRLEELKIQKAEFDLQAAQNKEARAAEAHASRLAADAKRAEATKQQKSSGGISPQDRQMLESSEKAKFDKAIAADQKAVAAQKAAAVPPAPAPVTPAAPTAAAPAAAPAATPTAAAVPPKTGKWPGGAEGSAVQLFGGTKKNFTPESQAAVEMFKDFVGGPLTMPPTGGTIHQINEASKFYEKHTGQELPRNAEGKLTRIPEEQMQKLHTGIRTELEDAVKGNKLGTLGKGAMAAAALLGLTGAVQAAQKGDFGPLRQAGFDIGGPIALGKLGIAALSRAAGSGFAAATYAGEAGEANEAAQVAKKFADAQKLGSPYRSVPPPR